MGSVRDDRVRVKPKGAPPPPWRKPREENPAGGTGWDGTKEYTGFGTRALVLRKGSPGA
ncbi:MAG: hypothetical protein BLITH_0528 [Brockia lithotrophica]|uniref:Uncharacterized protein n=1 Tax=Brockia lithotrophica TaxID=933949 RepID=A0A2T5G4J9_9BACL|nr:MAG: hypothetical protein BLITH_0528 [Brockia lithotrophica]